MHFCTICTIFLGDSGGWGGGIRNVIHIASMPKTLVFTAILPLLYNILHKDVEPEDLS